MEAINPVGEYAGDVRDLPQIPVRETPEVELLEPDDYVHNSVPINMPPEAVISPTAAMPPATISFSGMSYADNYCQGGQCGAGHPPDTTGAVGRRHYIQAINSSYAIYDKATGTRLAAFTEGSLWSGATGTACNSSPRGDAVVLYDQTADRWILTNFAFDDNFYGPFYQCFAVSKSSDPVAGGWWFYALRMDQGQVPTYTLNDYPKFGIWNDGCLYMGANGFTYGSYSGQIIFGINRSAMYSGGSAHYTLGFLSGSANWSLFPANMLGNGASLPSPTTPAYFVQESQTEDAFNIRTLTADACDTGGTVGAAVAVPHATYNYFSQNIVPQPPPADNNNNLDSLGDRMMQWIQYRKIGSAESLWVNHTT